jgi:hypothetical protein
MAALCTFPSPVRRRRPRRGAGAPAAAARWLCDQLQSVDGHRDRGTHRGLLLPGFFSIYIRHCYGDGAYSTAPLPNGGAAARSRRQRGLDAAVIETFPTMAYADVREHKTVKGALECAVCLSEFDDDETLRLLPKCSHVFHPDCIDTWLASHVTCPVCRANLVPEDVPEVPAQRRSRRNWQRRALLRSGGMLWSSTWRKQRRSGSSERRPPI